jgi:hypothetical protein
VKTRLVASVALAGALLLGMSACTLSAVQGTLVQYEPSDGTAATVGDIKVRNLIGLSDNGDDISLLMTIVNGGDSSASVNFQYTDSSGEKVTITIDVPGNSSVHVGSGGDADEAILRDAGATVGGLIPVYVQYGDEPGEQVQVPVLDGATEAYADLLPQPLPTFTPTPTPTPTPTETPAS